MQDDLYNLLGIPAEDWAQTPQSVQQAVLRLLEIVQAQSSQFTELQTKLHELELKLGQSSRNSSKPPSSDPPSHPPAPPRTPRGRKAGAQVGHRGHHRPAVPPEQVEEAVELQPTHCPHCQTGLKADLPDAAPVRRTQVWELPLIVPVVTEYRQHSCCCPNCQQLVTAELPADMPPGAFGPRASALMALLRSNYHLSLEATEQFFRDVCNLPVSSGCIVASCERVSEAIAPVDAEIQELVQSQPQLNVDETSWPIETRSGWLWVAVCTIATCFRICKGRGRPEAAALLGAYRGIVGSDRLAAYKLLPNEQRQLCWAHLIRNLLALQERYAGESGWAGQMLELTEALFFAWHRYQEGWFDQIALQQALMPVRLAMAELLSAGVSLGYKKIAGFSRELRSQWDALWTFSRVEGVEPTNNAAERALRPAVLWRKSSYGSRSAAGCRFVERMLSVCASCAQQGQSPLAFITEAVRAAWAGAPAPTIILQVP